MQVAISQLPLVLKLVIRPQVHAFPIELSVLKFPFEIVSIRPFEGAFAVDDIGVHVAFVGVFDRLPLSVGCLCPGHLAMPVHLGIDESANVMPTIGPLELTVAFDLGVLELASVYVVLVLFSHAAASPSFNDLAPLLEAFTVDFLTCTECAGDLYLTKFELLNALASHLVSDPVSIVF